MRKIFGIFLIPLVFDISGKALLAQDKIRLSVSTTDVSFLSGGVALKRGFFKEESLEAEVIRMSANVSMTALATGDIDYTMLFGSVVRASLRGLPLKVVACSLDSSTHTLISRPEFKSVKELKRKTLGVSTIGATADVAARMMIKHYGIDPDREMKIVPLGPTQARFAALKEGIIEVTVISPPGDVEAKKIGFNVLARAYELFKFPFSGLAANVKKIREKPDEVKRVIKALIKANQYIRANREGTIQVLMEWGRTDRESAAASYDATVRVFNSDGSIPEDGLRTIIEQAKKEMRISREVAFNEVSDLTALREAQRELGIKGR